MPSFNAILQYERVKFLFVRAMKSRSGSGGTASLSTSALNGDTGKPHAPAVLPLFKEIQDTRVIGDWVLSRASMDVVSG